MNHPIDLSRAKVESGPFPHFYAEDVLDAEVAEAALRWFEAAAPWDLTVADFYEQHEFSLLHASPPPDVAPLCDPRTLGRLREDVGSLLGAELGEPVDVTVPEGVEEPPGEFLALAPAGLEPGPARVHVAARLHRELAARRLTESASSADRSGSW